MTTVRLYIVYSGLNRSQSKSQTTGWPKWLVDAHCELYVKVGCWLFVGPLMAQTPVASKDADVIFASSAPPALGVSNGGVTLPTIKSYLAAIAFEAEPNDNGSANQNIKTIKRMQACYTITSMAQYRVQAQEALG